MRCMVYDRNESFTIRIRICVEILPKIRGARLLWFRQNRERSVRSVQQVT